MARAVRFAGVNFFQRSLDSRYSRGTSASTIPYFNACFARQRFSGEDDVQRLWQAYQARQARGAAPRWNQSDLRFRQTDARGFVGRGHALIARERNFKTAADACAMNGGDRGQWQRGDAVEDRLAEFNQFAQFRGIRFRGNGMQIRARDENGFFRAGQDQSLRVPDARR